MKTRIAAAITLAVVVASAPSLAAEPAKDVLKMDYLKKIVAARKAGDSFDEAERKAGQASLKALYRGLEGKTFEWRLQVERITRGGGKANIKFSLVPEAGLSFNGPIFSPTEDVVGLGKGAATIRAKVVKVEVFSDRNARLTLENVTAP